MRALAFLPEENRRDLFNQTAAVRGLAPGIVEKDFWVCWVLDGIFSDPDMGDRLRFKGGTSLSKAYNLIQRFSEDIDIILDWRTVTDEDPTAERSNTQQNNLNERMDRAARAYISQTLAPKLKELLAPCTVITGNDDDDTGHVVLIQYPRSLDTGYVKPEVRLEIGPLAAWLPAENVSITPYAAEVFPEKFSIPSTTVRVISARRTFWEKATILHHEANRPETSTVPERYSRHYYDMYMMAQTPVKQDALEHLNLLEKVVAFKKRFYPRGWANYDDAAAGLLRLIPPPHVEGPMRRDYAAMREMIFGTVPDWDVVLEVLERLQDEINLRTSKV